MSLSINKLEKLLVHNGIFPDKYYKYHGFILFIECVVVKSGQKFWLDIPSNYKFKNSNSSKVYELKSIDIDDGDGEVVNEFAKQFNDLDVFNSYEASAHSTHEPVEDDFDNNISTTLADNYKYSIRINEIDETDEKDIRDIKRQLSRLRYSVIHTKYNVCLTYKQYFGIIYKDEVIMFMVKNLNEDIYSKFRQLNITVDLELFYDKIDRINPEITKIKSSIDKILDINYNKNISNIKFMMNKSGDIINKFNELYHTKTRLSELEYNFEALFKSAYDSEKRLVEKISLLKESNGNEEQIMILKDKIKTLEMSKMEVLNNISTVSERKDNITLTLDKILFDNIVMFNSIIKNFELLLSFNQ